MKPRIRGVEDEQAIQLALSGLLGRAGYDVSVAGSGEEALASLEENPYDLVLTDLQMPEKDGIETIMELRAEFPDVGILAVSGGDKGSTGGRLRDVARPG